jgi:hypothetical protein
VAGAAGIGVVDEVVDRVGRGTEASASPEDEGRAALAGTDGAGWSRAGNDGWLVERVGEGDPVTVDVAAEAATTPKSALRAARSTPGAVSTSSGGSGS